MSKLIAKAAIDGSYKLVSAVEAAYRGVLDTVDASTKVGFPNTAYYLPVIYSLLGLKVRTIEDLQTPLEFSRGLLPPHVRDTNHLPYFGPMLDSGMAALIAAEIAEALRYLTNPGFYHHSEEPDIPHGRIWLGAADDTVFRKRGVEFVDGSAPGFAVIIGSAPDSQTARMLVEGYQKRSLYVFLASGSGGTTLTDQLLEQGVQIGWQTRIVPFGADLSAAVFALGFAARVAMAFGHVEPGDYSKLLRYSKDRIFAFVNALGNVGELEAAVAAGCLNWGVPTVADVDIPGILPSGICTYEQIVSNVSLDRMCEKSVEVRGLKASVAAIDIPCAFGPAYEGERVRGNDLYAEMGAGKSPCVELVKMAQADDLEDGNVELIGPDIADISQGEVLPLGIFVQVAGRGFQKDFEPILERQIHHLLNYIQGIMHIGQRDITWMRISKEAVGKGFSLRHIGTVLHARFHQEFSKILDKVQVTLYTRQPDVQRLLKEARSEYDARDRRVENMADEDVEFFYSCTLCQSFAPSHVCTVTPERTGLCGAYNWMDCKAAFEINPNGPNQPVRKGRCIDPVLGQWEGVNEFVFKASRGSITHYNFYSMVKDPMTTCGCCECIAALLPLCNGIMTVCREYSGETPCGMRFTTLAGVMGGGVSSPGFVGHSKFFITQRKFISGDGGLLRMVWMPSMLKQEIKSRLVRRGNELGVPGFYDMIADETIGVTEEEILPFLKKMGHPALGMVPIISG